MRDKKEKLLQKRLKLFKKIEKNLDFIKGSISKVSRKNKITGEFYHLTYKDKTQKTHTVYIPANLFKKINIGIKKMKRIKELIDEINTVNIKLLKQMREEKFKNV